MYSKYNRNSEPWDEIENTETIETPGGKYWRQIDESIDLPSINLDEYDLKEDDAGRLMVDLFLNWIRFNTTDNSFMIWTGTHWTPDKWKLGERMAAVTAKTFQKGLADAGRSSLKEYAYFVSRIRSASGARALLFYASSDPRITTSAEDYDRFDDLLNTPTGTVELETGNIREHRREDLLTKITTVSPARNEATKYFNNFLDKITIGREDLKKALQRFLGSGCSGRSPKEAFGAHYGGGQNGKTVLLESVHDVLGGYASTLDIKSLSLGERQSTGHQDDIASLAGVRYVLSAESGQGIRLDEAKVKKYTGGDTIPVSRKHGRTFNMKPCFTLSILTNNKPRIAENNKGIWRRVLLFPYDYEIPDKERDKFFKNKMLNEDAGYILQWLIDGAKDWYANNTFNEFSTVINATNEYRKEEDVIGRFIDEVCSIESNVEIQARKLREAYEKWCNENSERPFSGRAWSKALEEHGLTRKHTKTGKIWQGICLQENFEEMDIPF